MIFGLIGKSVCSKEKRTELDGAQKIAYYVALNGGEEELNVCALCGYCSAVCPIYEEIRWESSSPRGKLFYMKNLLSGKAEQIHPEFINRLFQCSMGGRCETVCQTKMRISEIWEIARAEVFERGLWPEQLRGLGSAVESSGNIFGCLREKSWSLTDEVAKRRVGKKAKIVYFVGCVSSYMNCFISIPRSFVHIMEKLNLEYTLLGAEERCFGTPLFSTGGHEKAEKLARHNVKKIEELGAEIFLMFRGNVCIC